jgi:protein-S-isoprenylcysteine O-methyltransferase Ste14
MEKIKFLLKGLVSTLTFSLILFVSAGKVDYTQGWIYLSTNLLVTFMNFLAMGDNTELIIERSKPGEGAKSWDKLLLGISGFIFIFTLVLAGLDSGRYQWTRDLPWGSYVAGILLTFTGQVIFLTARNQNKFFSSIVRIQKDRGHTVCDTGIYRFVRHPGYLGMIVSLSGIPFLVGSVWSAVPVAISIALLFIRTSLEDKTLKNELNGYVEYARKTRFKLIPGIW